MISADQLNTQAATWAGVMLLGLAEATALLLVVLATWGMFRRRISPQLASGLFLLVPLKLVVPIPVAVPAGWLRAAPGPEGPGTSPARAAGPRPVVPEFEWHGPAPAVITGTARPGHGPGPIPPTPEAPPASRRLGLAAWLMLGWAGVVVGLLIRCGAHHLVMSRRLRGAQAPDPAGWPADLAALARRSGVRGEVPIAAVAGLDSPAVWGLARPVILWPSGLEATLSADALRWVLLHELAHIRRRDGWVVLFQRLVGIAYFFHPAVWAANRLIDAHREYACDDAALALAEAPRHACGAGFLAVVERAHAAPSVPCPSPGMIRPHRPIRSRLMRILDGRRRVHPGLSLNSAGLLVVAAAVGLPRLHAGEEAAPAPPATSARQNPQPGEAGAKIDGDSALAAIKPVAGIVLDRDGTPIAGALMASTVPSRGIWFEDETLDHILVEEVSYARSRPDGSYLLSPPLEPNRDHRPGMAPFGVFAYHATGYARKSAAELARSSDLVLEPWGRVEGTVTVLGKPLADVPIRVTLDATDEHSMGYEHYEYAARTDAHGRFAVERVLAGVASACTGDKFGKDPGPHGIVCSPAKSIHAGATLRLDIGGPGRPVEGKVRVREGIPIHLGGASLRLQNEAPPEPPKLSDEAMGGMTSEQCFRYYFEPYRSPAGLARRLAARYFPVQIRPNGTFRAVDVEPGTYTLTFHAGETDARPLASLEVVVPPIPDGRTDDPLDVGTVFITPPTPH